MAEKKLLEVFGEPNDYLLQHLGSKEPRIWNGVVDVKRYRITIEEIEEPKEVLKQRLQALLLKRGHISDPDSIRTEAKRLGITLDPS